MTLSAWWQVVLAGCCGGLLAELVRWFALRESPQLPGYLKSLFYWVVTLAMILCGGGLALLYQTPGKEMSAILAVNVGASAPLIISRLASTVPPSPPPPHENGETRTMALARPSLISFLGGP